MNEASRGEGAGLETFPARRVTFMFSARTSDHHGSLLVHLLQRARRARLAGSTAFEADRGYGVSGGLHRHHAVVDDAPVMVVVVDRAERITAFLSSIEDLLDRMTVVVCDVEVVARGSRTSPVDRS